MITQEIRYEIDETKLGMHVTMTAATVLVICQNRQPAPASPAKAGTDAYDPIATTLCNYVGWPDFIHTNALQLQVEFLYDFVQMYVAMEEPKECLKLGPGTRQLVVDALSAYQVWKTAHVAAKQTEMGERFESWDDATSSHQKDWTDLNEQFRAHV